MTTRLLSILSLILLLVLVLGVGYSFWIIENPPPPTYIPTSTPTIILNPSLTPTTPFPKGTVTPTPTPTPPPPPTPPPTPPPPTPPPPTPPPPTPPPPTPIYGVVKPNNLNVRRGPGTDYGYVGVVHKNDQVTILGREPRGFWLEVETPDDKKGWVVAEYISIIGDPASISIVSTPLPPLPRPTSPLILSNGVPTLTLRSASVFGEIAVGEEQRYIFFENQKETVLILMFRPQVNVNKTNRAQFTINQAQVREPNVVGMGSHPASDRDGDLNTGELVWRGGPLVLGAPYYLRIVNNSSEDIQYCLATRDIYEWSCAEN